MKFFIVKNNRKEVKMINNIIGNTPMVKIKYEYNKNIKNIYAKLEYYNYTGSIKDRLALYILTESKRMGLLKDNQIIVEATSGNTGISFAALGAYFGHEVHIFMPTSVSVERRKLIELYGAKLHLIDAGFKDTIKEADLYARKNNAFRPNQFSNVMNINAHYYGIGEEIINKSLNINGFVSGIGTGGTLMGVGKRLKEYNKKIKIIALEPKTMPLLSEGKIIGPHKIEGIGDDFIPKLVDKNIIDEVISIDDEDAINMSRILSQKFGLGVGISSGANFLAGVLSKIDNLVTVFADDSKKYLSTDLIKPINNEKNLISNNIKIISIEFIK